MMYNEFLFPLGKMALDYQTTMQIIIINPVIIKPSILLRNTNT